MSASKADNEVVSLDAAIVTAEQPLRFFLLGYMFSLYLGLTLPQLILDSCGLT